MPVSAAQYQMAVAFPGQRLSIQSDTFGHSALQETINPTNEYIPFGSLVVASSTQSGSIELPSATGQTLVGLAPIQAYQRSGLNTGGVDNGGVAGIPPNQPAHYSYRGVYAVVTETALTTSDTLYYRHTDEAVPAMYDGRGRIRNDDAGGNADQIPATELYRYRILEDVTAGQIARLEIDFAPTLLV